MGNINSKECEKWRQFCVSNPVFPLYGIMETRYNEELEVEYFPTLAEFYSEVLEAMRMDADLQSQDIMPDLEHCEEDSVPYIIVGLSQFWREKFPFEETIKFLDIQEAARKFAEEETAWISQNHPVKISVATESPKLRSVVVVPDKAAHGVFQISVENKNAEDEDIIDLSDHDPIQMPLEKASKEGNKKVNKIVTSPSSSYKSYYKERLAKDPEFAAQEKLRQKLNFKERRRRKRVAEAMLRHQKSEGGNV